MPEGPSDQELRRWAREGRILGTIVFFTGFPYVFGFIPFALAVVLVGFEIFVSSLQAFIFAVLTASYLAGALAEEH